MDQLFNTSICTTSSGFFGQLFSSVSVMDQSDREKVEATNAIVLESSRSSTILIDHPKHELDSIFLINSGRMVSVRPSGKANWHLDTPAKWTSKKEEEVKSKRRNFQPKLYHALQVYDVEEFGKEKCILAQGDELALVSPTGQLLTSISPVEIPVDSAVVGDFNNDGINDIIIITAKGYYGYTLTRTTGSVLLPLLSFVMFATILSVLVYLAANDTGKKQKIVDGRRVTD